MESTALRRAWPKRAAILIVAIATAAALLAPGGWDGHAAHDTDPAWPFGAAHAQQADTTSFKTTWKTDSANEGITLPVRGSDITIYWGDGANSTGVSGDAAHTYAAAGNHTISVSGGLTGIFLNGTADAPKLVSIDQWGNASWTTMDSAFKGAEIMVYKASDAPDLSAVTNMTGMFYSASSFNGNITSWSVSSVTDMADMFFGASSFNGNISSWDVSSVTDMGYMFASASAFNGNISTWNVSSVRDMSSMFSDSLFNGNISTWDVSSVRYMHDMFYYSSFNGDISTWDVSSVTDMDGMFAGSLFNGNISTWDVSSVTDMVNMFASASAFNGNISTWDVSSVRDMASMFAVSPFNGNISTWDVSSVTDMRYMFSDTSAFNGDISSWDVSLVTDMRYMFIRASAFNGDISSWDVSSVRDMDGMFAVSPFNGNISTWDVSSVTDMRYMFSDTSAFNGDISSWDVSSVTDMDDMFEGASAFSQNLGSWYVALDDTTISVDIETLKIRAQNAYLEGQNPVYMVNDANFILDGNGLLAVNFTNPPSRGIHPVNITATGDPLFGTGNSIVTKITVDVNDFSKPFTTTWRTDSANQRVTIPFVGSDININWGDGNLATSVLGTASHTYAAAGRHTVSVSGGLTGISLSGHADAPKLVSIDRWGAVPWTSMRDAFRGASNMVYRAADTPDLSVVTSMASMFSGASSFNQDISSWNVSQVTDMAGMFSGATSFNRDISSWNVSQVTNMAGMFSGATSFNQTLSTWNVSQVTDMAGMFSGASSFNQDISAWNVLQVTRTIDMFNGASSFNQDLNDWDVSAVRSMAYMFSHAALFNGNISSWNISSVTDMGYMFEDAFSFNQDISTWDVSLVRNMDSMFLNASSFNQDLNDWDVSAVRDMSAMFSNAFSFDGNISTWNVSSVTSMDFMFAGSVFLPDTPSFSQDISTWNVSSVTDMSYMFYQASSFNQDISTWNVSSVRNMARMLSGASSFNQDISAWDVSSVRNMARMLFGASSFNQDISTWNVSSVWNMAGMFNGASAFDQNLGRWYVTLSSATIPENDIPGVVGDVSAQNAFLNGQRPAYGIGTRGDSPRFNVTGGNMLNMTTAAEGKTSYTVNITAAGSVFEDGNNWRIILVSLRDTTGPTPAISTDSPSPTNAASVTVAVDFGEPINGTTFTASDISVTGGKASVLAQDGLTTQKYNFTVTPTSDGEVTVTIPADSVTDPAGNDNAASNTLRMTFDSTRPSPTLSTDAASPTNAASVTVAVDFGEPIDPATFTISDVSVTGGAASSLSPQSGNQNFTFTLTPSANGQVTASIPADSVTDPAGNDNAASNTLSVTFDTAALSATLSTDAVSPTSAGSVTVTAKFGKAINATTFALSDIATTGGTASALVHVSGNQTFTFTLTPASDGTVTAAIPAGRVADPAANANTASNTLSVTFDTAGPVITITGGTPVSITAGSTYSDRGATCRDETDGDLTSSITATSTVVASTAGTYQVTYTCTDSAGNSAQAVRTVLVTAPNNPPMVDAGPAQTANEDQTVTLAGTATDPDQIDTLTYSWFQTSPASPTVSLGDPASLTTTFTAPPVTADTAFTFTLSVSDGTDTSTDTVTVTVEARSDKAGSRSKTWTVDDMVGIMGGKGQHDLEMISRCDEGTDPTSASTELHLLGLLGQASYGTFNVDMETTWVWIIEAYRLASHSLDTGKDVISEDVYEDGITLDQYIDAAPGDVFEYPDGNYTKAQLGGMTAWSASIDWAGDGSCSLDFRQETWAP